MIMYADVQPYINAAWLVALVVWVLGAVIAKRTARTQSAGSRLVQQAFFLLSFLLLFKDNLRVGPLAWRFVPRSSAAAYTGLLLTIAGVAFAIWGRFHLGGNWSGTVTIKQDHKLIRTGPYAIVRHPIYTGFEFAILGTAVAIGEVRGLVATGTALIGMRLKARAEEAFMTEQFGAEYAQYKKHVRSMIPFVW
jgi:protein-S-isoprenylcysteine O-methyltransferase Ste14